MKAKCQLTFGWNHKVGTWWVPLPVSATENVHPCGGHWAERVQSQSLLGPLAAIAQERSQGRGSHHWADNQSDHLRWYYGAIPLGVPVKRNPRAVPYSQEMGRRDPPWDPRNIEGASLAIGRVPPRQGRSQGEGLQAPKPLECWPRLNFMTIHRWPITTLATFRIGSRSHVRRPWGWPGMPTIRYWQ